MLNYQILLYVTNEKNKNLSLRFCNENYGQNCQKWIKIENFSSAFFLFSKPVDTFKTGFQISHLLVQRNDKNGGGPGENAKIAPLIFGRDRERREESGARGILTDPFEFWVFQFAVRDYPALRGERQQY